MKLDKYSFSNTVKYSKITDELFAIWEKTGKKTQRKDKVTPKTYTEKLPPFLNQLEEFF